MLDYLYYIPVTQTLCYLGLSLLTMVVSLLIYKLFINPYLLTKYYTGQGLQTCYFPGLDVLKSFKENAIQHGDCIHPWKAFVNENPDSRAALFNFGPLVFIQILDPQYIKEFVRIEDECYEKGNLWESMKLLFSKSIGYAPPAVWKARRRLYSQAFQYDFLEKNVGHIEDMAIRYCDHINPSNLKTFDSLNETKHYFGLLVGQFFFGEDLTHVKVEGQPITRYIAHLCDEMISFYTSFVVFMFGFGLVRQKILPSHREFFRKKDALKKVCRELIAKKESVHVPKESHEHSNLLEIFINAKNNDPAAKLDDDSIVEEFTAFFFAGLDTTAVLLSNAYYYIAKHPEVKRKLNEEIKELLNPNEPLTIEKVGKLDYMHAFLKEVLRHANLVFVISDRVATKDHQIFDMKIKKGTVVQCGVKSVGFNPKYFHDPWGFEPERFIRKDPTEGFNSEPFAFLPFYTGKRNCLGQRLAILEAKVFLIHVLQRYDIEVPEDYKLQLTMEYGFYGPRDPLKPKLIPKTY